MPVVTRRRCRKKPATTTKKKVVKIHAGDLDYRPDRNTLVLVRYPSASGAVGRPRHRRYIFGFV